MATVKFRLKGELLDTTGTGHEGLRVIVSNTRNGSPDLVLVEETDDTGEFRFVFDRDELRAIFGRNTRRTRGQPSLGGERTLYFSVFDGSNLVHAFTEDVSLRELVRGVNIEETFALPTGGGNRRHYVVKGLVRHPDGTPVDDALVTVNEVRLRSEVELGTDQTNGKGKYRVFYRFGAETNPDGPEVVLSVTATDPDGNVIAGPIRVCDPDARQVVDLVVGNVEFCGPSQYTVLTTEIQPWLDEASLELKDLTAADAELVSCGSGLELIEVARLIKAARVAEETGIAEVAFFGWFASGVPATITAVIGLDPEARRAVLEQAAERKLVPAWDEAELTALLAALEAAVPGLVVPVADPTSTLLGTVLDASGIDVTAGQALIAAYRTNTASPEDFWTQYASDNPTVDTPKLIFSLQASALTGHHSPLTSHLVASNDITETRQLATFSQADWEDLLNDPGVTNGPIGVPAGFPGDSPAVQVSNYATMLVRVFEDVYPTASVAGSLKSDATQPDEGADYMLAHPEFDLARSGVDAFVADNPPTDAGQTAAILSQLKSTQRLFRIAPRFGRAGVVATLTTAGLSSSRAVVGLGRSAFVSRYADTVGGRGAAKQIFERANQVAAMTMTLVGSAGSALRQPTMPVLPGGAMGVSTIEGVTDNRSQDMVSADLATLFGPQDYCSCRHCRSVFGPAAYLTDIIKWVCDQFPDEAAYNELRSRREDVVQTLLNCKNANTVLPKIDLVNEVLERHVLSGTANPVADWYQTNRSEEELRAHPEHLAPLAYEETTGVVYPWTLPFSLSLAEARVYLKHLGAPLYALMEAARDTSEYVKFERLGLSRAEAERIIDLPAVGAAPHEYWGVAAAGDFPSEVQDLKTFLDRSRLTLDEVDELSRTRLLGGGHQFRIEYDEDNPCVIADATIEANTIEEALSLVHRLVRLQRATGWSFGALDAAFVATVSPLAIEEAALEAMAYVEDFQKRFSNLDRFEALAWFGDVDHYRSDPDERSYYERVFVDEDDNETLWKDGAPPTAPPSMVDARDVVLGAMRISDEDLSRILAWMDDAGIATGTADVATLSAIFRRASLARALGISVEELDGYRRWLGVDPFPTLGSSANIEMFLDALDDLRAGGVDRDLAEYLLDAEFDDRNQRVLSYDDIASFMIDLARTMKELNLEFLSDAEEGDPDQARAKDEVLEDLLGRILTDDENSTPVADLLAFVRDEKLPPPALTLPPELAPYAAFLPLDADNADHPFFKLAEQDVDPPGGPMVKATDARAELILAYLRPHLRLLAAEAAVAQAVGELLDGATRQGEALLGSLNVDIDDSTRVSLLARLAGSREVVLAGPPTQPAWIALVDLNGNAEGLSGEGRGVALDGLLGGTDDTPSPEFAALRKLHRVFSALSVGGFSDAWVDLALNGSRAAELGLPAFDDLGFNEGMDPLALRRLLFLANFRGSHLAEPEQVPSFIETLATDLSAYGTSLANSTGWEPTEVTELLAGLTAQGAGFSLSSLDDLEVAADLFALGQRLGVAPDRVLDWGSEATNIAEVAIETKAAAKAKHSPAAWPDVIEPLRDVLREQQRDALVDYILATNDLGLTDTNDLFAHFLIDTQTSACTKTSRIKCAISSVQTFVQRMLLNLEGESLRLTDIAGEEWRWMSRFRIWEANRRIFLYPENWLEPDLRDGKTPLFEALEGALLEGELDDARAEAALTEYLEGLDAVARLKVVGAYHELEHGVQETAHVDRYHVVARTSSAPPVYYHRIRIDDAYWTPWERLPFQIDDERVLVTVYRRRLMMFWPQIIGKQGLPPNQEENGRDFNEIRMFWTQRNEDGWAPPQLSDAVATSRPGLEVVGPPSLTIPFHFEPKSFFLYLWRSYDDSQLRVRVLAPWRDQFNSRQPAKNDVDHFELANFIWDAGAKAPTIEVGMEEWSLDAASGSSNAWFVRPVATDIVGQGFEADADVDLRIYDRPNSGGEVQPSGRIIDPSTSFRVVVARQDQAFLGQRPFVLEDRTRSFFVSSRDQLAESVNAGPVRAGTANPDLGIIDAFSVGGYFANSGPDESSPSPLSQLQIAQSVLNTTSGATSGFDFNLSGSPPTTRRYSFYAFYHPYAGDMLGQVRRFGVDGLLKAPESGEGAALHRQQGSIAIMEGATDEYSPSELVARRAVEDFDFNHGGAYADYNWELFFHAPMLIADQLMAAGRFEESRKWMHYVFDPTNAGGVGETGPERFWKIKPFFLASEPDAVIDQLLALSYEGSDQTLLDLKADTITQIQRWRKDPFKPHLIARLRPIAYQRWVVMKYIDLLMAWGDNLFRQDTIESNNEALQLYVLAANMLGDRPLVLPEIETSDTEFATVKDRLDEFSNFLAEVENISVGPDQRLETPNRFVWSEAPSGQPPGAGPLVFRSELPPSSPNRFGLSEDLVTPPLPAISSFLMLPPDLPGGGVRALYFCLPPNSKLLGYWDTVADRLFKLRNCQNIEGVARQLPLFQPPIDPGLLAKAAAAGLDLASALSDLNAPLPHYRFRTMISIAKECCGDVRSMGGALLQALTSQDGEGLAQLRAGHEVRVLDTMTQIMQGRIDEAREQIEALSISRTAADERQSFYKERVTGGQLSGEKKQLKRLKTSAGLIGGAGALDSIAGVLGAIPQILAAPLPPLTSVEFGGQHLQSIFRAVSAAASATGGVFATKASTIGIETGYERRDEDWTFQGEQAGRDVERMDREILAAQIRLAIAERDLEVHLLRRDNAQEVFDYLKEKFTNEELFRWMASEIKRVYFQGYQLAYDEAKRAERCYRFELGVTDASFINFGYWDNARKGLLSGDRLMHDLRRMESSYLAVNRREYELSKRISLAQLDPDALERLKATGKAEIILPQWIFDLDHPSHYMRRIKMVDLTIPALTGAFTNIPATLTYTGGKILRDPTNPSSVDSDLLATVESIAASTGQADAGLFESNMNDERYVPFECKGLVDSSWTLKLPAKFRQFDYRTISDVIFTVRYCAREGGEALATVRETALSTKFAAATPDAPLYQLLSLRGAFPETFNDLVEAIQAAGGAGTPGTNFELSESHFPYLQENGTGIQILAATAFAWFDEPTASPSTEFKLGGVTQPSPALDWQILTDDAEATESRTWAIPLGDSDSASDLGPPTQLAAWNLEASAWTAASDLKDLLIVVQYKLVGA